MLMPTMSSLNISVSISMRKKLMLMLMLMSRLSSLAHKLLMRILMLMFMLMLASLVRTGLYAVNINFCKKFFNEKRELCELSERLGKSV